jgi:hypothetical protein
VRLNAKAMGYWKEYEKQKNQHLVSMREQMNVQVQQRKIEIEE